MPTEREIVDLAAFREIDSAITANLAGTAPTTPDWIEHGLALTQGGVNNAWANIDNYQSGSYTGVDLSTKSAYDSAGAYYHYLEDVVGVDTGHAKTMIEQTNEDDEKSLWDVIQSGLGACGKFLKDPLAALKEFIKWLLAKLAAWVQSFLAVAWEWLQGIILKLYNVIKNAWDKIKEIMDKVMEIMGDAFTNAMEAIIGLPALITGLFTLDEDTFVEDIIKFTELQKKLIARVAEATE